MSFADQIHALAAKVRTMKDGIETEEATKNAFIMPFISSVLGYDVFDPNEVVPEFHADVGVKRGEKIDYAIKEGGEIRILIECKKIGEPLSLKHASQLFRYFAATHSRIAILTNGQEYQVYTDGDLANRMDERPFLVFDILDIDRTLIPEIQKLSKENFDLESVVNAAEELKYIGGIKRVISSEVKEPSDEWIRYFIPHVYEGKATQRVVDQFRELVSTAVSQYINAQVNERLKHALGEDAETSSSSPQAPVVEPVEPGDEVLQEDGIEVDPEIVTTEEELDGFNIVRAIAVSEVAPERVTYRDAKSYFAIFLDDNNRKPIIRLHLNGKTVRYVTCFDEERRGVRHDIETVVDIYQVADRIRGAIRQYEAVESA